MIMRNKNFDQLIQQKYQYSRQIELQSALREKSNGYFFDEQGAFHYQWGEKAKGKEIVWRDVFTDEAVDDIYAFREQYVYTDTNVQFCNHLYYDYKSYLGKEYVLVVQMNQCNSDSLSASVGFMTGARLDWIKKQDKDFNGRRFLVENNTATFWVRSILMCADALSTVTQKVEKDYKSSYYEQSKQIKLDRTNAIAALYLNDGTISIDEKRYNNNIFDADYLELLISCKTPDVIEDFGLRDIGVYQAAGECIFNIDTSALGELEDVELVMIANRTLQPECYNPEKDCWEAITGSIKTKSDKKLALKFPLRSGDVIYKIYIAGNC